MGDRSRLHELLDHSASLWPERIAIEQPDNGSITYRELAGLADRMRDRLREMVELYEREPSRDEG